MLTFLKRWRKAYLEDKGNRLHAEAEIERNTLCQNNTISLEQAMKTVHVQTKKQRDAEEFLRTCREYYYYN